MATTTGGNKKILEELSTIKTPVLLGVLIKTALKSCKRRFNQYELLFVTPFRKGVWCEAMVALFRFLYFLCCYFSRRACAERERECPQAAQGLSF
jgi:hypothetical protein